MPDVKNTINGLQQAIDIMRRIMPNQYWFDIETPCNDAIALLKAQGPRVMTPQDFDGNPMKDQYGNLPCWLESREPLVASNWCRWNEDDFIRPMMRNFRPWTSRPTDEQREATPW